MARTKPGRAARRMIRDRVSFAKLAGLVAGLLLLASGYLWVIDAGMPSRTASIGGPFKLVQGDGRQVTDQSFRGKYLLIYFGYTSCRDVCPITLASMATALDDLGETASKVQPLFITVDPDRDTPSVVQRYASLFTPKLVGLTGLPNEIRKVADEYRVSSVIHHGGTDPAHYVVDHSSVIYLVGPDGRYIAPIRADEPGAGMARIITGHLSS
jgi:protein SCO1/2